MSTAALLMDLYRVLREAFGHRGWWPGETPFEVMVGAVLTQRTNWRNAGRAIAALKEAGRLDPVALSRIDAERLQELVRPAGYYRQKTARLQRLAAWLVERAGADPGALGDVPTDQLRGELLALRGIGPETADSILLYALGRPTFVVDTYTKRVVVRHQLLGAECGYRELKDLFESSLPQDVELFKDYHAQLVEVGKRFCRTRPRCAACPVHPLLGEPVEEEWF
ncbi:MAG: endonuclease III domain-containing protein [Planctomycetota bacterium]|jgi:endonuclease-3 related protein